jgi:cellulose binding protein with CBM2 domain/carbohydrate esterase-like protein/GDSL-like lipase/acylhydrolase family protein
MNRRRRGLAASAAVSGLLAAGVAAQTLPASAVTAGCTVTYTVQSQWTGGFQGDVSITNLGDPLSGWTLTWSYSAGQTVTQSWGATVTQSGGAVTAVNAGYTASLPKNGSESFGFNGTWNNTGNPVPTSFSLDGTVCNGTVVSVSPTPQPPSPVLANVNTVGQTEDAGNYVQYAWPGIYFEARFQGTGVGIVLDDSVNDYDVAIDGTTVAEIATPGQTTYWVNNLTNGVHTVRLDKRTESPWTAAQFGGFVAAPGGSILSKPAARTRQIEFIGDSYTAGYGNLATQHDCSGIGGVEANSNADLSFGAMTAHSLNADYQINAMSGMGVVRNYNGSSPGTSFLTYYGRTLEAVNNDVWYNPGTWHPQLVVVGLGINDFSTPLNAGEQWTTTAQLAAAYKAAYQGFINTLRSQYGPNTIIVVSATALSNTTLFGQTAQQVVADRNAMGDSKVYYWYYDSPSLDHLGCDYHPSLHDDQIISGLLNSFIATLPLTW